MSTPPWGEQPEGSTPPPEPPPEPPPVSPPPPPSPYGQPAASPYQPYGAPPTPYGAFQPTQQTNGLAIASLVVSIGSIVLCCGVPGIVGAILGHVARKQIKEQDQAGDGMALAGIIVGWVSFGLVLVLGILYVVLIVIVGVWAESVDDCYDDYGNYTC